MVNEPAAARPLLIVSAGSGGLTDEVRARLDAAFGDHLRVDFDPQLRVLATVAPKTRVVVAGGDGTVAAVTRRLAGGDRPLAILALGTFNNFARSLGLPADLEAAIEVARGGSPRPITLGMVGGTPFLEAAAVGMFGEAIALGEAAKDMTFGELGDHFRRVSGARTFKYTLSGDLDGHGEALSLVFANTPSIGAKLPVAASTPLQPYLELSVQAGASRSDLIGRLLASSLLSRHEEAGDPKFRLNRVRVATDPPMEVYADNLAAGMTPVEITARVGALQVILPDR